MVDDRNALIDALCQMEGRIFVEANVPIEHQRLQMFGQIADMLIVSGVRFERYGVWELKDDGGAVCSQCHRKSKDAWDDDSYMRYCPHCGAAMMLKRSELKEDAEKT